MYTAHQGTVRNQGCVPVSVTSQAVLTLHPATSLLQSTPVATYPNEVLVVAHLQGMCVHQVGCKGLCHCIANNELENLVRGQQCAAPFCHHRDHAGDALLLAGHGGCHTGLSLT